MPDFRSCFHDLRARLTAAGLQSYREQGFV